MMATPRFPTISPDVRKQRLAPPIDIPILVGHCAANPYGGYSAGAGLCTRHGVSDAADRRSSASGRGTLRRQESTHLVHARGILGWIGTESLSPHGT